MTDNNFSQPGYNPMPAGQQSIWSNRKVVIILITLGLLLLMAIGFGAWAYSAMLDYKQNSDTKVSKAVAVAEQKISSQKDNEFAEKLKLPYKTFKGSETYGSVSFQYPNTWSGYVNQTTTSTNLIIDGYFYPDIVPGAGSTYALRLQVVNQSYSQVLAQFESKVKNGKSTLKAFRASKVPDKLGSEIDGELVANNVTGKLIVLPLRDKAILIWTETDRFNNDFTSIVLPSLTFVP